MSERPYELAPAPEGMVARVRLRGSSVLSSPLLNRGTAFTLAEREVLGLIGLLPDGVSTIDGQLRRGYSQVLPAPVIPVYIVRPSSPPVRDPGRVTPLTS